MRVFIRTQGVVSVTPQGKKRAEECRKKSLCMWCLKPLGDSKAVRHAHPNCARTIYRHIERGLRNDEGAVADGLWAPQETPGPKPAEPASFKGGRT